MVINMTVVQVITGYVISLNLLGFLIMGIDKYKAKKGLWRIPEATLFIIALIGGSIGSIIGMYTFRHKTRHFSFVFGMPAILVLQIISIVLLIKSPLDFEFM